MLILTLTALAAATTTFMFSSGYLFGARRGAAARRLLFDQSRRQMNHSSSLEGKLATLARDAMTAASIRESLETRIQGLEVRLREESEAATHVNTLRNELHSLTSMIQSREKNDVAMRVELRNEITSLAKASNNDPVRFERELRRIVGPLIERQNDTKGLRELVQKTLTPIMDRERLVRELADLESGASLNELPRILDAIAQKGSFSSVVLSDDVGLPLAASSSAKSVDWLAGMASLILTLVERSERVGEPKPIGVVIHDESNQMVLHRIFRVGAEQFLLTAVSRGVEVAPSALDPALGKLERALSRPEIRA